MPEAWIFTLCTIAERKITAANFWSAWSFAPEVIVPFVAYAVAYAVGWTRMSRCGADGARLRLQGFSTAAGLALLAVALISPLCRLSAVLASAHMVQHAILVAVAPPLLWLGSPGLAFGCFLTNATPQSPRRRRHVTSCATPEHRVRYCFCDRLCRSHLAVAHAAALSTRLDKYARSSGDAGVPARRQSLVLADGA